MVLNSASRLEMRASTVVNAATLLCNRANVFAQQTATGSQPGERPPGWGSRCADKKIKENKKSKKIPQKNQNFQKNVNQKFEKFEKLKKFQKMTKRLKK